jgi:beta-glucosidase
MTKNNQNSIDISVNTLLSKMSLAEKVGQMAQLGPVVSNIESIISSGAVGSILGIFDPHESNKLQKIAIEETRLGIPLLIGLDVIHGFRTIFPIPLAAACSWHTELVEESAAIAAEEATANGVDWTYAPMVDICRDPRWGRIAEGSGEDPFLGSEMARSYVRGFQRMNLESGRQLIACVKHFAAYGATESGKDYNTVDISERTLRDVHLPPFRAAIDEGVGSIMVAFNELNGIPASANTLLLKSILRDEWKYKGVTVSDYSAILEMIAHGFSANLRDAAKQSALAGMDVDMMSNAFSSYLTELVNSGEVPVALVDGAVSRVLRLKFMLGLFENPYVDIGKKVMISIPEHFKNIARQLATESIVLLKNKDEVLPIKPSVGTVGVIGPLADDKVTPLGCWHCNGREDETISALAGITDGIASRAKVLYAKGCNVNDANTEGFTEAIEVAKVSQVIVAVLGEDWRMSGEAHCRARLDLPGVQQQLLELLVATGKPVIVVLMTGRPLVIPWMEANVAAILQTWHLGTESGNAVADILLGKANPSGRLAVSFPMAEGQIPVYYSHKNTGRPITGSGTVQFNMTHKSNYLDIPNRPLFPFGFGLSYTKFEYSDLRIETPSLKKDQELIVQITVENSGKIEDIEIVQLYVRDRVGSVTRPVKELKGFRRVALKTGEKRQITFRILAEKFGFTGADMCYRVEPGMFDVWIGSNSEDGLHGEFEIC